MLRHTIPLPSSALETSTTVAVVNRLEKAIPVRLELIDGEGRPLGEGEKRTIPARSHLTFEVEVLARFEDLDQGLSLEVSHFGRADQISAWLVFSGDPRARGKDAVGIVSALGRSPK